MRAVSWPFETLELLMCPRCPLYMEPYFIQYTRYSARVIGGDMLGEVLTDIREPYDAHAVQLVSAHQDHIFGPDEPKHRVGVEGALGTDAGDPCPACARPMSPIAVIDSDDQNVPLHDDLGNPTSLVIGDGDSVLVSCCSGCATLGFKWVT